MFLLFIVHLGVGIVGELFVKQGEDQPSGKI